jgi:DtxR family Mn-dependent transcriptional regulator
MTEKSTITQSRSVQNFLKAVYTLQRGDERVSTNALAEALAIKAPSVTDMARQLEGEALIDYEKYRGVRLTETGVEVALKVLRRHRLIELYLVEELGYALHEVHAEAEELEHHVSDRFVDALAHKLGDPATDPHGDPIPSAEGIIARRELLPLSELPAGQLATVARFKSDNAHMLEHILSRGFRLDSSVEVLARDPFEGPLTIRLEGEERVIGCLIAAQILVALDPA